MWRFLGLCEVIASHLQLAAGLRRDGDVLINAVASQTYIQLRELASANQQLLAYIDEVVLMGLKLEADLQLRGVDPRAPQTIDKVIVCGDDTPPPVYAKVATDVQGRQIAWSLYTPQLILFGGGVGTGKTHAQRVFCEGAGLFLPGLSKQHGPVRTIQFETDFTHGEGRRQMLCGYNPNRDRAQLRALTEHYDYRATGNEAYTYSNLFCLPNAVKGLTAVLPAFIERGLQIIPTILNPSEMGLFAYRSIFGSVFGLSNGEKPSWLTFLEARIGELGDKATPAQLILDVEAGAVDYRARAPLINQLKLMVDLVSPDDHLMSYLREPKPSFVLLEDPFMSPDLLLSFQVALIRAMMGKIDGKEVQRIIAIDEFSKIIYDTATGTQVRDFLRAATC